MPHVQTAVAALAAGLALAVLAAGPVPAGVAGDPPQRHAIVVSGGDVAAGNPSAVYQYATALRRLGSTPRHVWMRGREVWALTRDVRPERYGRLAIDAAIAASVARRTCRCDLRAYRLVSDRYGFDVLATGVADPDDDGRGTLDDRTFVMDSELPGTVRRRVRQLADAEGEPGARRVTRQIRRGGVVVFAMAYRPATGERYVWSRRGFGIGSG